MYNYGGSIELSDKYLDKMLNSIGDNGFLEIKVERLKSNKFRFLMLDGTEIVARSTSFPLKRAGDSMQVGGCEIRFAYSGKTFGEQ